MTDANGNTTTYSYNTRHELAGMTDPANQGTGATTTPIRMTPTVTS